jgi:hypothetical protein
MQAWHFEKGENREEKIDKFLDSLAWYHSEKSTPVGFFSTIGRIEKELTNLNENIKHASESSDKLIEALNKISLWGVRIAAIGIFIAACGLAFEIYKYAHGR